MNPSKKLRELFLNDEPPIEFNQEMIEIRSMGQARSPIIPGVQSAKITVEFYTRNNYDLVKEFNELFKTSEEFAIGSYDGMIVKGMTMSTYTCVVDLILRRYDPNRRNWKDWFYE